MQSQQPLPPEFAEPLRRAGNRIGPLASRVMWYSEITSTNDVAVRFAEAGGGEGLLVAADAQTAGRGRQGRRWASPPGAGIYATVVFRPDARMIPLMTIAAGVSIAEGIESTTRLPVGVKWPNDVFVHGGAGARSDRKIAGILAEGGTSADGAAWVVIGFGINVFPAAYPPEIAMRATSLEGELGRPFDRGVLLAECLAALWRRYLDLRERRHDSLLALWRARAAPTLGRRVEWDREGRTCEGVAHDIDETGALLVRTRGGIERVIAGELRWT
jgi:BirA family transcriptional regulator, biotin operon repressor / biotin---[acetyl-CoA-carboxylase] ligase